MNLAWESARPRVGDTSQLVSVTPVTLRDGRADGVRALQVRAASGLEALVLADRGLDIGPAYFRGTPLAWISPTGPTHPAYFQDHDWLRSFHGGLLTTCGLANVGPAATTATGSEPMHGRYSNLPGEQVGWDVSDDGDWPTVTVRGTVRETTVYGSHIAVRRTITFPPDVPLVRIRDEMINRGWIDHELLVLYHVNIGFPVLDDHAELVTGGWPVTALNDAAAGTRDDPLQFAAPTAGQQAEVYRHEVPDGPISVGVWNGSVRQGHLDQLGVAVTFDRGQLPYLMQWRMPGQGTYVTGIEPSTCLGQGLATESAAGRTIVLRPGERRRFEITVEVVESREAIGDPGR